MITPKISILDTRILSDNWYTLKKITFEKTLGGGLPVKQDREVYDRGNGATILLYNKEKHTILLTRQFRLPTYVNGNTTGLLIESCAGLLDQDNPEECIRRETEEETGYKISAAKKVFEAYMSPGSVTEILYFFIAEYAPEMKIGEGGGLDHENEDIEVLELSFTRALEMMNTGEIRDGKTMLLLQYAQMNRILTVLPSC
jgi:nudix-type nucleoside diphosphatase (YffH/AdpP family)